jgi:anthranilate phosphoribosyltransferase
MIRECILKLSRRESLTSQEAAQCLREILEATATPAQVGAYLSLLAAKNETVEEVLGSLEVMRDKMVRANAGDLNPIDVVGTGGDHKGTFNISTTSAFILAGGGVPVAKHGNRASSSKCGSAEVLEALGVKLDVPLRVVENCLRHTGMCFLYANQHHPAMKYASPIRREIGIRTIFNILGPMSNPMGARRQLIGVYDNEKTRLMCETLVRSGSEWVLAFHSQDGMDEVSCDADTLVYECKAGQESARSFMINPETFGFQRHPQTELVGGDAAQNATIVEGVLDGEKGARREVALMSAALGFYVAEKAATMEEGARLAEQSLDGGHAKKVLEDLRRVSHQ